MKVEVTGKKTGVAVSGGRDSMALLCLYLEAGVRPVVLNVEHGIRGEVSKEDSAFVERFARSHGLEYYGTEVDAPGYAATHGVSEELAARTLRYAFFDDLLRRGVIEEIALAHHADDNAETVLMRLFRGTGLKGLCGIVDRPGYIHPLIRYTRKEIDEYVEKYDIPYVEDETNGNTDYTRNFIRNVLLPEIKTRYPEVVNAIGRLSESAAADYEWICRSVVESGETDNGRVLKDAFSVPESVLRYSVKTALCEMGVYADVEKTHLDAVVDLIYAHNNATMDLPFGVVAERCGKDLYLVKKRRDDFLERPFEKNEVYTFGGYRYSFVAEDEIVPRLTVDEDKVKGCVIRTRKDGDKFRSVNGRGKLLSDYLNEKKLPKHQKDALLVMAKGEVVYAILGLDVAEEAKAEKNYLRIKKEKTDL